MDFETERYFVSTFIRKNRRDRVMHELTDPKKRYKGLDRFCHQTTDLIDLNKVVMKGSNLEDQPGFIMFMKTHDQEVAILSPDSFIDGQKMTFREAVVQALVCSDAVIIVGSDFAVIFAEAMKGGRDKYLLCETKGL